MSEHLLKVIPPYFDALADGRKTFEVRKNDRAYQAGDVLLLREWHPNQTSSIKRCGECGFYRSEFGHWSEAGEGGDYRQIKRLVTFVYSGDPRFGGIEPGYVVLGIEAVR